MIVILVMRIDMRMNSSMNLGMNVMMKSFRKNGTGDEVAYTVNEKSGQLTFIPCPIFEDSAWKT